MDGVGIYRELKERGDKWETDIVMNCWTSSPKVGFTFIQRARMLAKSRS